MSDENVNGKGPDPLADVFGMVDTELEENGEWFGHPPIDSETVGPNEIEGSRASLLDGNGNGLRRVFVHSTYIKAFQDDQAAAHKRALNGFRPGKERDKFLEEMRVKLIAKHCVTDWDFTNRAGEQIPITPQLVARIFTDQKFRHHRAFIQAAIFTHQGELQRAVEEDSGN